MLTIFQSSVSNVRELKRQRTALKRLFNRSLKLKDHSSFEALKRLYSLLYSSFAEISFLKIINTPYGFSEDEIVQIQAQRNLEQKWIKCLELAFQRIANITNKGEIQNKRQILERLIQTFIIEPSQLRNKIAHGQWIIALNNDNTAINNETTQRINNLDFVKIDILFTLYEKIGQVVEDLIESPQKTHFRDFYFHITELEQLVDETSNWTLASKILVLEQTWQRQEKIKGEKALSK